MSLSRRALTLLFSLALLVPAQSASAHSLTVSASATINVGESITLTNQADGCGRVSDCEWSVSGSIPGGTLTVVPGGVQVTAPSSLTSASQTFEIILTGGRVRNDDRYATVWSLTILDPNFSGSPVPAATPTVALKGALCDATTNGGVQPSPDRFLFSTESIIVTCPTPPERPGYTFKGWFLSAMGAARASFPVTVLNDIVFYAQWDPATLTLTCDATTNGGTPNTTYSYTSGGAGVSCSAPAARPGFDFVGWFTTASNGQKVTFPLKPTTNTVVYAQWVPTSYTVTCDAGYTGGGTQVLNYSSAGVGVTCSTPTARAGFSFDGWFTNSNAGQKVTFPLQVASNTTVYGHWTASTYVLTCDSVTNGGASSTKLNYTTGQTGVTCATPSARSGYAFSGWFTAASGGQAVAFPKTLAADTTVYAQWSEIPLTTQSLTVYYCYNCRKLDSKAKTQISNFVKSLPQKPQELSIAVTGFAQVGRNESYDRALSVDRARAVVDYLRALGVSATFTVSGEGWDDATAQARRAEVQATFRP